MEFLGNLWCWPVRSVYITGLLERFVSCLLRERYKYKTYLKIRYLRKEGWRFLMQEICKDILYTWSFFVPCYPLYSFIWHYSA